MVLKLAEAIKLWRDILVNVLSGLLYTVAEEEENFVVLKLAEAINLWRDSLVTVLSELLYTIAYKQCTKPTHVVTVTVTID